MKQSKQRQLTESAHYFIILDRCLNLKEEKNVENKTIEQNRKTEKHDETFSRHANWKTESWNSNRLQSIDRLIID